MTPQRALTTLCELCSVPTAPFVEARVVDYVRAFVAQRPGLRISQDRYGNLLVLLPGRRPRQQRWVFAAHMDHPGMVRLFVAIADQGHTYRPGHHELKARLARRFADKKHLLTEPRAKRRKLGASPGELTIHGDIVHADLSGDWELRS
jgi:hypothetical protein